MNRIPFSSLQPDTKFQISGRSIEVDETPGGKSPCSILIAQLFIVFILGNTANAADALQQLIFLGGGLDAESDERRLSIVHFLTGTGISLTLLLGYPISLSLYRMLGPRATCIFGIVYHFLGYFILLGTNSVNMMLIGIVFISASGCCVVCSSLSIACQFPCNVNLILCIFGVASEASPIVTNIFTFLMIQLGSYYARILIPAIIAIQSSVLICIAFTYLPSRPFSTPVIISNIIHESTIEDEKTFGLVKQSVSNEYSDFRTTKLNRVTGNNMYGEFFCSSVVQQKNNLSNPYIGRKSSDMTRKQIKKTASYKPADYIEDINIYPNSIHHIPNRILPSNWKLPLFKQFVSLEFWIFFPVFLFSFIEKKYILVSCRNGILENYSTIEESNREAFIILNSISLSGLLLIFWGYYVKRFGKTLTLLLSYILGSISLLCLSSTIMSVRIIGVPISLLHLSSVTGMAGIFCHDLYGFQSGHHTAGILTTFIGILSLGHDVIWHKISSPKFLSFRDSLVVLSMISCVILAAPLLLFFLASHKEAEKEVEETTLTTNQLVAARSVRSRISKWKHYLPHQIIELYETRFNRGATEQVEATCNRNSSSDESIASSLQDHEAQSQIKNIKFTGNIDLGASFPTPTNSVDTDDGNETRRRRYSAFSVWGRDAAEEVEIASDLQSPQQSNQSNEIAVNDYSVGNLQISSYSGFGDGRNQRNQSLVDSGFSHSSSFSSPSNISSEKPIRLPSFIPLSPCQLGDPFSKLADDRLTPSETITEGILISAYQIKCVEPLFPLLPIYEKSSSTALAESCVADMVVDEWRRLPSMSMISNEHEILKKARRM